MTEKPSLAKPTDGTKAADLFDLPLVHVLTVLLGLQLDTRHSRVQNILDANECFGWMDFDNTSTDKLFKEEYNDTESDIIYRFNRFDKVWFEMVEQFQEYLCDNQHLEADLKDPCSWSLTVWNDWRLEESLKSMRCYNKKEKQDREESKHLEMEK